MAGRRTPRGSSGGRRDGGRDFATTIWSCSAGNPKAARNGRRPASPSTATDPGCCWLRGAAGTPPACRRRSALARRNLLASARWLASGGPEPLRGLAWLEANRPRGQEVWLAPWAGGACEPAVRLVAEGPGSQTALDAAVLADGSWLLAWCAFDGEDDELVWRHGRPGGDWTGGLVSADNRVPDIGPRLLVTREGAALVWSRYDGRVYRVRTARFEDGRWSGEGWAGPPDSLYPEWAGNGGTLLYLEGATPTWTAGGAGGDGALRGGGLGNVGDARYRAGPGVRDSCARSGPERPAGGP